MNLLKIFYYIWPLVREVLFNHEQERLRPLGIVSIIFSVVLAIGYLTWTEHGQAIRESFFPSEEGQSIQYQELMEKRITELLSERQELKEAYRELERKLERKTWQSDTGLTKGLRNHIAQLQESNGQLKNTIEDQEKQIEQLQNEEQECTGDQQGEEDEQDSVINRIRRLY